MRNLVIFLVLFIFLVSFSGCATVSKEKELELQGLKNQVTVLETQIQAKDQEITGLKDALAKETQEKKVAKRKVIGEIKSQPSVKEIQIALSNAGYNPGSIDGKMGKATREAIRAFQKANNLAVDGRVGKQTWSLLKKYLEQKEK